MRIIIQCEKILKMKELRAIEKEIAEKLDCRVVVLQPYLTPMILPEST